MDTYNGSFAESYSNIKTARQKKRLAKKDFEKYLISLHIKQNELWEIKKNLPQIPLEFPYQKGWQRSYELRSDTAVCKHADFYGLLLDKLNTMQYSKTKDFKIRRRKNRKKIRVDRPQSLIEFDLWQWERNIVKLSEAEKAMFYPVEYWCNATKCKTVKFVFKEPWRFILKVRPHIITHQKMKDEILEQEIAEINNHIEHHFLQHKINKIVDGCSYHSRHERDRNPKHKTNYINELLQE